MRIDVLNEVEADEYASQILGESTEDYSFSARITATSNDPETAYEAVNRSTEMIINDLTDLAQEFDEHRFDLDIIKSEYADELEDMQRAYQILSENGMDFATNISVRKDRSTPQEAIEALEETEINPILVGTREDYNSAILYNPQGTPRFQPSVQPTDKTTAEEAKSMADELEKALRELNI